MFRLQVGLQRGTQAAAYEPTALRAQAFTNRLAYKQAIASYVFDWKALVATIGMQQLPLSEIAGRVDRLIPYYDYDEILAHVLQNHTDIWTARNGVKIAQYNLKLAQVTPVFPNLDVHMQLEKDFAFGPFGTYQTLALGFPLPIWDQNKGNIIAAQAALVRAGEEAHRVQVTLTNGLALAYENYRNNLYAMEYYRREILPDLVRYYRGVFERRQIDPSSAFGDLVFAQQNLSTNVSTYIGILGSLWSSVVSVADYLQTDDLFQIARPHELSEVPDLSRLPAIWECGHNSVCATPSGVSDPAVAGHPEAARALQPAAEAPMPAPLQTPSAPAQSGEPMQPAPTGAGGVAPIPAGDSASPVSTRRADPAGSVRLVNLTGPRPNESPPLRAAPDGSSTRRAKSGNAKPERQPGQRAAGASQARPAKKSTEGKNTADPLTPSGLAEPVSSFFGKGDSHDGQDH